MMNTAVDSKEMCSKYMNMPSDERQNGHRWKSEADMDPCHSETHVTVQTAEMRPLTDTSSAEPSTVRFKAEPVLSCSVRTTTTTDFAPFKSESPSPGHVLTTTCSSSSDGGTSCGGSTSSFNSSPPQTSILTSQIQPNSSDQIHTQLDVEGKDTHTTATSTTTTTAHPLRQPKIESSSDTHNKSSSSSSRATTMIQVKAKYMSELEYMLREFKKLQRQLLGAKACVNGVEESNGSKERREKLHSFIIHLEDTIRQIDTGCKHEKKAREMMGDSNGGSEKNISIQDWVEHQKGAVKKEEEEEEMMMIVSSSNAPEQEQHEDAVHKLEEHIRTNLLPVKIRLNKQLAAQLGASQNPVGMPVARSGLQSVETEGKGTFAVAAEQKRLAQMKKQQQQQQQQQQQHVEKRTSSPPCITTATAVGTIHNPTTPSQFGKPLGSDGSSLTHKLHGETLGSESRPYGYGVGSKAKPEAPLTSMDMIQEAPTQRKTMMVAGIAPGSDQSQIMSSLSSVNSVHRNYFGNPQLDTIPSSVKAISPSSVPPLSKVTTGPVSSSSSAAAAASLTPSSVVVANPLTQRSALHDGSNQLLVAADHGIETTRVIQPHHDNENKVVSPLLPNKEGEHHHHNASFVSMTIAPRSPKKSLSDPTLTLEERAEIIRRRLQKKKRRLMSEQLEKTEERLTFHLGGENPSHDGADASSSSLVHLKKSTKVVGGSSVVSRSNSMNRNGPKAVEYICALCNETYTSTCDSNPWWTLNTQECPKCLKVQIPRIDISSSANEIEYHPALLVQAAEDNNVSLGIVADKLSNTLSNHMADPSANAKSSNGSYINFGMKTAPNTIKGEEGKKVDDSDQDSSSDLDFGPIDGDDLSTSDSDSGSDFGENMSLAARAEHEEFGKEYSGPKFMEHDSSRLLVLMNHATTCPGL